MASQAALIDITTAGSAHQSKDPWSSQPHPVDLGTQRNKNESYKQTEHYKKEFLLDLSLLWCSTDSRQIHLAEDALGPNKSLISGPCKPTSSLGIVTFDSFAIHVSNT